MADQDKAVLVTWSNLILDPENPRLPLSAANSSQQNIFKYIVEEENPTELAQSMLETGFFMHEQLLVGKPKDGKHVVLEGNRRLTALMIIHNAFPDIASAEILGLEVTKEHRDALQNIPCVVIADPATIHAYIGFRHVGGIKPWSPEAKARFVVAEVDRLAKKGAKEPFKEVGRTIGSNALGVRNSYVALRALIVARDTFGVLVEPVLLNRFGVWMRCLNVPGILEYIGLDEIPKTYEEVGPALEDMDPDGLNEVIADLTESRDKPAILEDSRDASDYGQILQNPLALETLRGTRQIELAKLVIDDNLIGKIEKISKQCELLIPQVEKATIDAPLTEAVDLLVVRAKRLQLTVAAKA